MNNQQKSQIIKSMAYGLSDQEIVEVEGMTLPEVAALRSECQEDIAAEREWQKESGYEGD